MKDSTMIEVIRKYIKEYAGNYYCMGVSGGVPEEMRDGSVDDDGWVPWKVIPSNVTDSDLLQIEKQYGFKFPPYFSGYLKACFQLFDQIHSNKYEGNLVMMSCCPSDNPLGPLRELIKAWSPLVNSGYVPFAEWNDGWGPMCLDLKAPTKEGDDFRVVWFDHDEIIPLGENACGQREQIEKYFRPLYGSFKELFFDVYAKNA